MSKFITSIEGVHPLHTQAANLLQAEGSKSWHDAKVLVALTLV